MANVRPGTTKTSNAHAANAHAGPNHAKSGAAHQAQANASKNGANKGGQGGGQGGGQRNFPGRAFRGFSASNWLPAFGIYVYLNPDDIVWYYWYEPSEMYLPVSYINDYPPTTGVQRQ
jgi:hypothetical protein